MQVYMDSHCPSFVVQIPLALQHGVKVPQLTHYTAHADGHCNKCPNVQYCNACDVLHCNAHGVLQTLYCQVLQSCVAVVWCRALLACMEPLERVFKDADNVALASVVSTVQVPGGPGPATQASPANPAAVSMFDDDLDVGAPAAISGTNRCDVLPNGHTGMLVHPASCPLNFA